MPRGTGFRGPLFFSAPNLPFDGIPLALAQRTFQCDHLMWGIGNGMYDGPAAAGTENGIVVTDIAGTGAVTVDTAGRLVITTGTTDENRTQIQFKRPQFAYSALATRDIAMFARLKVSTATTTDALFGLASVDTTVVTAAAGATDVDDGIFLTKAATATDWTGTVIKDATGTTATTGITIASDTFMIVGFTVKAGVIRFYAVSDANDVLKVLESRTGGTPLGAGTAIANTNAPDDTDLCPTLIVGQEGGATARVLTVDWAFCAQLHV